MIDNEWKSASLRIASSILSKSEITDILNQKPSRAFDRGELMSPRNPSSQKRESALWILESGLPDASTLDDHILVLISFIERKHLEFMKLINKCEMDIFCGLSIKGTQANFSLSSKIIKRLNIFPVDIVFDLYSEDEKGIITPS